MLEIELTRSIKKDLKKYQHKKDTLHLLQEVIGILVNSQPLPPKYWVKHRECHVKSDTLLIYKIE